MMHLVEEGKGYRIFSDKLFGIVPRLILEDTRNSSIRLGVTYEVKFTNFYFKTLEQVRRTLNETV